MCSGEGGTRSRFTMVGRMKINTLDGITNMWLQYPDSTCLRPIIEIWYVSTVFKCMLSGVGEAGKNFGNLELIIRVAIWYIYIYILFELIVHTRLLDTSSFIFKCAAWLKSNSYFPYSVTVFLEFKISLTNTYLKSINMSFRILRA